MKNKILLFILGLTLMVSCNNETDLYPLSQGSVDKWFSSETEIKMSLNDLYKATFWGDIPIVRDRDTDDLTNRTSLTSVTDGSQGSEWATSVKLWSNSYKAIGRVNTILASLNTPEIKEIIPLKALETYIVEALFIRAAQYGDLVNHFGDVVYTEKVLSIDEALTMSRMPKEEVLASVYRDLDKAAEGLPASYGSQPQRATKGAAYALKARIAIRNHDYKIAESAAKACMDLGEYELHGNFTNLFVSSTRSSKEYVFTMPRSLEFNYSFRTPGYLPRNHGGTAQLGPSWDLAASYLCIDGLPIDESPSYDPCNPFENRDPRMASTLLEVGKDKVESFLGIDFDPNPYSVEVMNHNTGKMIKNNDSRINTPHASYNGLMWCKGINDDWLANGGYMQAHILVMRYADVLLMYAEAKIELNEIDQTVLDAINLVRSRAYNGTGISYPAVTTTDQAELRTALRVERRMEFAWEGHRYYDIIRWRIAEKVLNIPNYGILDPANELKSKVIDKGLWFFPGIPEIDENGSADYSAMEKAGLIRVLSQRQFNKRQYLWAIPAKEIVTNKNLTQNEGY